jgi:hypothetical protein
MVTCRRRANVARLLCYYGRRINNLKGKIMNNAEAWQIPVGKFLQDWRILPEYAGALLCGSYAVGTPTPESDIDLHIILSDTVDWRERGDKVVDGRIVEYFVNPLRQFPRQHDKDVQRGKRTLARMLATGIIVEDRSGDVLGLKEWAERKLNCELPILSGDDLVSAQYALWDSLDGVLSLISESSPQGTYCYYMLLDQTLRTFASYHGVEAPAATKAHRFFTDPGFAAKYRIQPFSDIVFSKMYVRAVESHSSEYSRNAQEIVKYVLDDTGGFSIDGCELRTPVERMQS